MDDDATALLLGDLAESTKLPRELLARQHENRQRQDHEGQGREIEQGLKDERAKKDHERNRPADEVVTKEQAGHGT